MAAPWENLLSVEHLTSMDQNTSTKQTELFIKKSRGMQLQQRLQELKARERRAQQHNRQLLLQFERAQDTLKEMLDRNAAMKTIRMEYERYLEENLHRWQQQLQEKTEASHKKRMEDCLKSYLQHSKDQVSTATVDEPLISQGSSLFTDPFIKAPKVDAPQTFLTEGSSAYRRHRSSCYPHQEPTWLTQTGVPPGFFQTPFQPQCPSPFPPPNFPYPHPLLLQHLNLPFDHHRPWVGSEAAGLAPERYSHPCSDGIAVGSPGQLHTEEPPASSSSHTVERENETSAANSKRVKGGRGGRCLSSELDIKPVRLSSGHVESSESGRDSSLTSRNGKKREKKERTEASSSESERPGSLRSSRTSSEVVAASCTVALDSETSCSSEEGGTASRGRSERGRGTNTGSPPSEKEAEKLSRSEEEEQTDSLSEKTRSPAQDNKSGSCKGDDIAKSENRDDEEVYSSEQSIAEEKDGEEGKKNQGSVDEEKEKVKREEGGDVEEDNEESNDEVSPKRNQKEDKNEEEDKDQSEKLENESRDDGEKDSDSSQDDDEEEREGSERIEEEEEEESNEEEDQLRSEEAGDSEDSIICPQENRSKQMKNIPEEAAEDESDTGSSNSKSKEPSEEDIENLLAPQKPINKKQNAVKTEEKPKATCLNLGIFQVTEDGAKMEHKCDSDESDHFYD